jgi:hypothetical protein
MIASTHEALDLCRGLLAFTTPGTTVPVPHAALEQLVELAAAAAVAPVVQIEPEALQKLFDVAALAKRYNRAAPTVRQWFHDGLFGPPEERRFRGRGYLAPIDAVRAFEERTGLKAFVEPVPVASSEVLPEEPSPIRPRPARTRAVNMPPGPFGTKIFGAQGGRTRR